MWIQTPMLVVHLKSFGSKRLKLTESFWHGPCASLLFLCDHCSLVFVFSFLSLGSALHYIHAFHSMCFLFYIKKKKGKERKEKGSTLLFLQYSLCFLKTRLVNLFSQDMFVVPCLAWMSFFYCILLVEALKCMLYGKDVYGVYHFVLILKSHVVWLSDLILLRKA